MTKKDFELIARAVLDSRPLGATPQYAEWANGQCDMTAERLADALATTNPKFDRARFLAACGVQDELEGR